MISDYLELQATDVQFESGDRQLAWSGQIEQYLLFYAGK
jgi:hypothetical protein